MLEPLVIVEFITFIEGAFNKRYKLGNTSYHSVLYRTALVIREGFGIVNGLLLQKSGFTR